MKYLLSLSLLFACFGLAFTQDTQPPPIRFARYPALSPDAKTLCFSYKGDLWTVPSTGGTASRLTVHVAYDHHPAWSPDGKWIAFSSDREGNDDVYVMPATGGRPKRLTFHSANDLVNCWSADGKRVIFVAQRDDRFYLPYEVDVATGAVRRVNDDDHHLRDLQISPDGKQFVATRGRGSEWRRGYRGSGNDDLCVFPAAGGAGGSAALTAGKSLTNHPGRDKWPLWSRDGANASRSTMIYFVSDRAGNDNLFTLALDGTAKQLTFHKDEPVREPTIAANGELIVYSQDFRLWAQSTKGGPPKELLIYAPTDDKTNVVRHETFTTASEFALSPDGKQGALVVHGDIFLISGAGGEAKRLTETTAREHELEWAPDGKTLAFVSDRDGSTALTTGGDDDIYTMVVETKAVTRVTQTPAPKRHLVYSHDGKQLAYLRGINGVELVVRDTMTGAERTVGRGPAVTSYDWSPDDRWLAWSRLRSSTSGTDSEIFVARVEDPQPVNVTRYPMVNGSPHFSRDGKLLVFTSNRTQYTNGFALPLQPEEDNPSRERGGVASEAGARGKASRPPASASEPEATVGTVGPIPPLATSVDIDFDNIHKRARQVTRNETNLGSFVLSPDCRTAVFAMTLLGNTDLYATSVSGTGLPARLTAGGVSPSQLQFNPEGTAVYFLSGGTLRRQPLPAGAMATVNFTARMEVNREDEISEVFDEGWRAMRDGFYDEKMHGADWNACRAKYRALLPHATERADFGDLFNMMLGELNSSHQGFTAANPLPATAGSEGGTAALGLEFDNDYGGPGLKIKSVVPRGPAARAKIAAGEFIVKIDGKPVARNEALYELLNGKSGKRLELLVNAQAGEEGSRKVTVRAIGLAAERALAYDTRIERRKSLVDEKSNKRLGYVHLAGMLQPHLELFRREVFGDYADRDGVIIDVRDNGGGGIAGDVLVHLQAGIWGTRTMRGATEKMPAPLANVRKPIVVLMNENSFSNAEVFPAAVRSLGLGKLIGVATYGGVIGTGGVTLLDGSSLRMPGIGAYTLDGKNLENYGVPPDLLVINTPEDWLTRHDRQLERAVEELMKALPAKATAK